MKSVKELSDHLNRFIDGKALFPTFEELDELCGHRSSKNPTESHLNALVMICDGSTVVGSEENQVLNIDAIYRFYGFDGLNTSQRAAIDNLYKKYF